MDVFERVRDVNAGTSLTEDRIIAARLRLLHGIDDSRSAERKRLVKRPMFVIAGAVAGVAAVTAGVVVVGQLSTPAPQTEAVPAPTFVPREPGQPFPKPEPTSGTTITAPFPGTTPQAGQYLSVVAVRERLVYLSDGGVYSFPTNAAGTPLSAVLLRSSSTQTMPADRAGEWATSWGPREERVRFFGQDDDFSRSAWDAAVPFDPTTSEERSTGGLHQGDAMGISGPTYYDGLPREPQALLDHWYEYFSRAGESRWDSVMYVVLSELKSNVAPADVRKAYLDALQLSGRAVVESSNGSTITYAVEFGPVDARRETISIDTSTGWVTEYTETYEKDDGGIIPQGIPDSRVTIETTIVDSAP